MPDHRYPAIENEGRTVFGSSGKTEDENCVGLIFEALQMNQTLHYTDENQTSSGELRDPAVCSGWSNWANGTAGRYEIKEFSTEEECEKHGCKLAASKGKRSYT